MLLQNQNCQERKDEKLTCKWLGLYTVANISKTGIFTQLWTRKVKNSEKHGHEKRKDCLETRAELSILCIYVEKQAILESTPLYRASECKETKKQAS